MECGTLCSNGCAGARCGRASQRYAAPAGQFNRILRRAAFALAALAALWGAPAAAKTLQIVALGDSLTAGYGLPGKEDAYPARLEARLREDGFDVKVTNAGVSGDTAAGGRARLGWTLGGTKPDIAIVALGANDALRGLPPGQMRENLDAIITAFRDAGAKVLLAGMMAPPNFGRDYAAEFNAVFPALAEKHDVPLLPFLLEGVAMQAAMNQDDGIHPNPEGVAIMVDRIAPYVVRLIQELRRK
ncbi:MAG: arylesterase [Alphaproteobacteria bacterium]|nr:arylesterase [Alphaproteobacteria bacterium]